jgi:RNA polymerase sigma-70 factor (ECF subfamily)
MESASPHVDVTDARLIAEYLQGNDGAFDEIHHRYFDRLIFTCESVVRSRAQAEDLAQESLLRALMSLDRFDLDRPLWPWLRTIAVRLAYNEANRAKRFVGTDSAGIPTLVIDDHAVEVTERGALATALKGVPERQQIALRAVYLEDRRPAEIASAMGLRKQALEQLLLRGRRKLAAEYSKLSAGRRLI